jgi:hypothetical protein
VADIALGFSFGIEKCGWFKARSDTYGAPAMDAADAEAMEQAGARSGCIDWTAGKKRSYTGDEVDDHAAGHR